VPQGAAEFKQRADAAARAGERASLLAEELSRRSSKCPSLNKRLVALNDVPPKTRADLLIAAAVSGLTDCSCNVPDLEGLEYVLAYAFDADTVRRRAIPLRFDPRAKRAIELPADATLETLVTKLTTEAGSLSGEPMDIRLVSAGEPRPRGNQRLKPLLVPAGSAE
jgi:hypothetical protein